MEEVYVVRHRHLVEGVPIRRIAREMGIDRNTVRRYLRGAPAGVGKPRGVLGAPVRDAVQSRAIEILEDSKNWTQGKQRLTAQRLYLMLVAEHFDVGYTVVKDIVREWKRQRKEVFVPLVYKPGDLAEVDFFEVFVDVAGVRRKAHMFVCRLMHSGRDFAWLYPRQDQTCFLDGHVRAFAHFGAVPHRIVYDNLKAAVRKILVGSERLLADRFLALATRYLFEASFARPRQGHDKGGVESRGKAIRWQELVPIPIGPDLSTISAALLARLDTRTTEAFADEQAVMLPLPSTPRQRRHVAFTRAADLVRTLVEARDARELGRVQRRLDRVDVLILDEVGFVPFDRAGGELLFNAIAHRYERRSVLVTTNLAFSEWPKVFGGDEKLTTALLDRLAHHAVVITTKGKSFRMRKRSDPAEEASTKTSKSSKNRQP